MDTTRQRETVVGMFRTQDHARDAIGALKDVGFSAGDISLLAARREDTKTLAEDTGAHAGAGAATGAVAGGVLGGLGGWLVGIGALAIPGIGPFIAAGAIGAAIAGAAVGAGVGAIAGALVGMGVPREEADWYEGEVKGGGTLVAVKAAGRYDEAQALLRRYGAYDIEHRDDAGGPGGHETGVGAAAGAATGAVAGTTVGGPVGAVVGGVAGGVAGAAGGNAIHDERSGRPYGEKAPAEVVGDPATVATDDDEYYEWTTDAQGNRVRRPRADKI